MAECPKCGKQFKGSTIGGHINGPCGVTPVDLFWQKVDKSAGPGKCWEWTAARTSWNYGHFRSNKLGEFMAHRLAWELANGSIPAGMIVMHSCDNPPCCNPDHLRLGTWQDNSLDMVRKGRGSTSKLTPAQVREIRVAFAAPYRGISRALARKYGVGDNVICDVKLGANYSWVK